MCKRFFALQHCAFAMRRVWVAQVGRQGFSTGAKPPPGSGAACRRASAVRTMGAAEHARGTTPGAVAAGVR